ncbi:magnesium transporter CorA family protein [Brevundimonas sp.]|uniref:magnesium transporter CorA family protein n=1 Tax=Brevundimonas sp. TaxID=1871086 RepID=UPI001A357CCF|nr:magnesium transporter CorA family protein [Brevundimonas sp.]MBJ7485900.1 magnesium transporter CorA family protein [Brevundimonas sp.]
MIRVYRTGCLACDPVLTDLADWTLPDDAIWIDLVDPSLEEDKAIETALSLSIPTRAEMAELEASSRLYRESGATYVTADIIHNGDGDMPSVDPVTFVLTHGPLVTIRYFDPKPFAILADRIERDPELCGSGAEMFLHLMEAIIDRASDILSINATRVEGISNHVFAEGKTVGFHRLIGKLGRAHIVNTRIEQSLAGLARVFAYVSLDERIEHVPDARDHLRSLSGDAASLLQHNQSVAAGINFQLSAALGLINIDQSSIVKVFSVATTCLMPPTLIGAIYGMNFDHMPELRWIDGYPLAILAMVISGIAPLLWFRRKGWL